MPVDIASYIGRIRRSGRRLSGPDDLSNIPGMDGWLSRQTIPDVYPRKDDPLRPPTTAAQMVPPAAPAAPAAAPSLASLFTNLTIPGTRPIVVQKGVSFSLNPGVSPIPLTNQPFYVEGILLNVPSTAGQSAFYGFGSSITTMSGEEIQPGVPQMFTTENQREQWEVQRPLEVLVNLIASYFGMAGLSSYRAPRVVWNTNDWYLVAPAATTPVSVTLFYTPEMQ